MPALESADQQVDALISSLLELKVGQLLQLVARLEQAWGVAGERASLPAAAVSAPSGDVEAKTYDVVLTSAGQAKISVIKELKATLGGSLKEAKELVEAAPKVVKTGASKAEASALKLKLEAAGAAVELK